MVFKGFTTAEARAICDGYGSGCCLGCDPCKVVEEEEKRLGAQLDPKVVLNELLKASQAFWQYANEFGDPLLDEPRVIRLKKAQRTARKLLKELDDVEGL